MRVFQIQRLSAIALVVFMALHMIVVHYPPGHLDFSRVLERLENPVWKVIDIAFLLTVLLHALTGSYAVLIDIDRVAPFKRLLALLAVIGGVIGFAYGSYTILSFKVPAEMASTVLR